MVCNLFMVAFSVPFNLTTPPKVTKPLRDITVRVGETILLQCIAIGRPKPTCKIYFNGEQLFDGGRVTITVDGDTYTLKIVDAKEDDSGEYTFVFTNPAGETKTSAKVIVEEY